MASLAIGDGPDVLLLESEWIKDFASKGYLLPVESYLKNTPGSNILRLLLPTVEWNGYQWATPFDMDPYVFVWQPKTLAEMGIVNPPITNKEWVNLLDKQMDRDGKSLLGINAGEPYALATLLGGMGANILQTNDESLLWLEQAIPHMNIISNNKQEAWQLLLDGEMPLYLSTYSEARSVRADGLEVEFPGNFYNESPFYLRSRSFAVSSQSTISEQSAEWISFMTSSPIQQEWFDQTDRLPSLSLMYADNSSHGVQIPFRLELVQDPSVVNMQSSQMTRSAWNDLTVGVNKLLTGQMTVHQFKEAALVHTITDSQVKD
ncbi:Bacterial extracellular solute-binding protein [compost metagenome]